MRCLLVLAIARAAQAEPIEYRFTGEGVGSVDDVAWTGTFAIVLGSDTANIIDCGGDCLYTAGRASIELEGIGGGAFEGGHGVFVRQDDGFVGFTDILNMHDLLSMQDRSLVGYALDTPIGPAMGEVSHLSFDDEPTAIGLVTLDEVVSVSFEAVIVPAPGAAVVLGVVCLFRRRRSWS